MPPETPHSLERYRRHRKLIHELRDNDPDAGGRAMNDWELTFVKSLADRTADLTDKQALMLEKLHAKIFD